MTNRISDQNECTFKGNLAKPPEIRAMNTGGRLASFSVACNDYWYDQDGNEKKRTEWVRVTVYKPELMPLCEQHLTKGSRVCFSGKMSTRSWKDRAGIKRYTTEIVIDEKQGFINLLNKSQQDEEAPPPLQDNQYIPDYDPDLIPAG